MVSHAQQMTSSASSIASKIGLIDFLSWMRTSEFQDSSYGRSGFASAGGG